MLKTEHMDGRNLERDGLTTDLGLVQSHFFLYRCTLIYSVHDSVNTGTIKQNVHEQQATDAPPELNPGRTRIQLLGAI